MPIPGSLAGRLRQALEAEALEAEAIEVYGRRDRYARRRAAYRAGDLAGGWTTKDTEAVAVDLDLGTAQALQGRLAGCWVEAMAEVEEIERLHLPENWAEEWTDTERRLRSYSNRHTP